MHETATVTRLAQAGALGSSQPEAGSSGTMSLFIVQFSSQKTPIGRVKFLLLCSSAGFVYMNLYFSVTLDIFKRTLAFWTKQGGGGVQLGGHPVPLRQNTVTPAVVTLS